MNVVPNERFLSFPVLSLRYLLQVGVFLIFLLVFPFNKSKAQLVINEISQGPSGSQEYVELLVIGTPTCTSIPTVDIRGWYLDDNNGFHANGSGTGIATGCVRFSQSSQWANVKIGTLIVIYNDVDPNSNIPNDDPYDSNNDCVYILPISSSLFEKNDLYPDVNSSSYPTSGFTSGGDWMPISMANGDDSFQLIDPSNLSKAAFSVSWNNNTSNTMIYFGMDASGTVMYMTNSLDDDPTKQSNWTYGYSPSDETPGQPNNTANADWIESMNNNCQNLVPLSVSLTPTHESCGMKDGEVIASVSGGTSPYKYGWSNGKTTSSITGLSAGTYSVTITDANGCTDYASISITSSSGPSVSITGTDASCGSNNGSAIASVSGGTSPYTYSWSNGKTTSSISSLTAGTYTLTVTDKNGCASTATITISNSSGPSLTTSSVDASCGQSNGTASVSVSGGTSPYTYSWSNGKTTSSITGLAAGTYTITVTDDNGCKSTASVTVKSSTSPSVSISASDASCGSNNGLASVTISGGTSPFTYNWSNGKTTSSISNLAAGSYSVTVTDDNGCTATASVTIASNNGPTLTISSIDASCGSNNGSASVTITGGASPFTYNWSNGKTTSSISNLAAGMYTVTVTDDNGCTSTSSVTVNNNGGPTITISSTNASCGQSNGSATASVSGGTSPYTYSWSNGKTTSSITKLSAGTYTLTVTDANGCTTTASVTINGSTVPAITSSVTNANCGMNDGASSISVSGGTSPYTYLWSNGSTGTSITNVASGSYTITVTDSKGCTATSTVNISNNNGPSLTSTSTDATCGQKNGSASVTITGGVSPFTYTWSNGATTSSISNLAAGNYTVTVTDATNCSASTTIQINDKGSISLTTTTVDATCGQANGSATTSVSGGSSPYGYQWSNGQITATASILAAGNYAIIVTDANGCTATDSITIIDNGNISITAISTDASCGQSNGSASVTVYGGTSPYSYSWSNGPTTSSITNLNAGNYSIIVTDAKGCSSTSSVIIASNGGISLSMITSDAGCGKSNGMAVVTASGGSFPYDCLWSNGQTTGSLTNVVAGSYSVVVTDSNGCTATATAIINDTPAPIVTTSVVDAACGQNNGSAFTTVSGGSSPYTYSWNNGQTSSSLSNLSAGSYTVILSDVNGCSDTAIANINNVSATTLTTITVDETCSQSNGSISITTSGGSAPFTYNWSNGSTSSSITNLSAGGYSVTVTDANGCAATTSATITNIGGSTLTTTVTDASCGQSNGSASVSASGGTSPYSYMWSNGNTSANATNLSAGGYSVMVTDANGCSTNASVVINDLGSPSLTMLSTADSCEKTVGTASATVSGGSGAYAYEWNNNPSLYTSSINNLSSGWHYLTVDDGNCQATDSVYVTSLSSPILSVSTTDENCNLGDAIATALASGGTGIYSYAWNCNPPQFTSTATNLAAGIYTVTIHDGNCSTTASVTINTTPTLVSSDFVFDQQGTTNELNTTVNFYNQSNNAQSVYWDFGDGYSSTLSDPYHTYTDTGTYTVMLIALDDKGCMDTTYSMVTIDAAFAFYIPNTFSPNGDGANETFSGMGVGITDYKMVILDRWGDLIYETEDLTKPWNGEILGTNKKAQIDVYIYKINVTTLLHKKYAYTGHVNLIR